MDEIYKRRFRLLMLSELEQLTPEIYSKLLIKCEWQKAHELSFLARADDAGCPDVVRDLLKMRKMYPDKYERLVESVKLQLEQIDVVANEKRVRPWHVKGMPMRPEDEIYEFKSSAGLGLRLFFFLVKGRIVVCTHGWIKNNEKDTNLQGVEFARANNMRRDYLEGEDGNDY